MDSSDEEFKSPAPSRAAIDSKGGGLVSSARSSISQRGDLMRTEPSSHYERQSRNPPEIPTKFAMVSEGMFSETLMDVF